MEKAKKEYLLRSLQLLRQEVAGRLDHLERVISGDLRLEAALKESFDKAVEVLETKGTAVERTLQMFSQGDLHGESEPRGNDKIVDLARRRETKGAKSPRLEVPLHGDSEPVGVALDGAGKQLVVPGEAGADNVPTGARNSSLRVLQDRLVVIIDDHEAELADSLRELGCGGDCYRCPKPNKATVSEQVLACLESVVQGLELDPALLDSSA